MTYAPYLVLEFNYIALDLNHRKAKCSTVPSLITVTIKTNDNNSYCYPGATVSTLQVLIIQSSQGA
jgi:hypothetical protein